MRQGFIVSLWQEGDWFVAQSCAKRWNSISSRKLSDTCEVSDSFFMGNN